MAAKTGNGLAENLWAVLRSHLTNRLVLELDEDTPIDSQLIGQLSTLYDRIHHNGGLMRIYGLTDQNRDVLDRCRDRQKAVMGSRPMQPR